MTDVLTVRDHSHAITYTFADMLARHTGNSPAGVAMAFKVMQRAFAVLSPDRPPQRGEVVVRTAFRGPGARDGFEAVTGAVTDGRYIVDRSLVRCDRGRLLEDFVFEVTIADRPATLLLRDGFVTDEFIDLARAQNRTGAQERRLDELKAQLAQQLMATPAAEVYDLN